MLLFILLVVVVIGVLTWLVQRSRRPLRMTRDTPTNPRSAQREAFGDDGSTIDPPVV